MNIEQLNGAQKILQEKLEFGLVKSLIRNQKASTNLRRTELTKDSVITKLGIYDMPNTKSQELEDKTCIVYRTALTRDYLTADFNSYKDWKVFKYEEFAAITNSVLEVFVNRKKIFFKDIEVRVRKDVLYLLIPKFEIDDIESITIFELPENTFKLAYNNEDANVWYPREWKYQSLEEIGSNNWDSKYPVAFNNEGLYNRIVKAPDIEINPLIDEEFNNLKEVNMDWNGEEFETYNLKCRTLEIDMTSEDIRPLIDNPNGFLFEKALEIDENTYNTTSVKCFDSNGLLMNLEDYEMEIVFKKIDSGKYVYLFRTKIQDVFNLVLHNNEWTQLNQFGLTNIVERFDKFEDWLSLYKDNYDSLPEFIKSFKNIEISEDILNIRDEKERFKAILKEYIKHTPEWYRAYLDTLDTKRYEIKVRDLDPNALSKYNNFDECESRFQRVDFGVSEHIMLKIRNDERTNQLSIYMNGLKYMGIRHFVHARNFTYIYLLKQALPDVLDENSIFEIDIKDDNYKVYSHTALFDGDVMIVIETTKESFQDFDGDLSKLKFFHNGRRLRREDIYYNTDSDGNHSFFFNIKTKAGDNLAIEENTEVFKEIRYIENLPDNGVLDIIQDANFKYPLSTKYYEIFINGRRISHFNEKFITDFMIQFKTIKGNHSICIYEIQGLDKETDLNSSFISAIDNWDLYIKGLENKDKYLGPNTIIDEDPYNKFIYTLAQYRMHLLYWWFLVPRVRALDCNPYSVTTSPEIIQEIERLFPDFVDGQGTVVLDTHHQQTSIMYLGHGLEGYLANMLYVTENIIPVYKPTDSNEEYVMRDLPYFKVENNTVQVNANVNGLPSLRVVPRLPMTQEEYDKADYPYFPPFDEGESGEPGPSRVIIIDSNYGLK